MTGHAPVMVAEALRWLEPARGGVFVDCTLGLGGHSQALLEGGASRVIAIDRDTEAIAMARERLDAYGDRVDIAHANYRDLGAVLDARGVAAVDGVLADLGVSSMQLDAVERGFSFRGDAPLDMRMDRSQGPTAADRLREVSEGELADVIYQYGEERHSRRIARALVRARDERPVSTTGELAAIVRRSVPHRGYQRIDPATRTFQALRIWVNGELEGLEQFVRDAVLRLRAGARLVVIAFHSLEDRIVKHTLRALDREAGTVRVLTARPEIAGEDEIARNPRARSAKLRAAERLAGRRSLTMDFEHAIKMDVRNNPIVRELDQARQRELWRWMLVGGALVGVILFSLWQRFSVMRVATQIESTERELAQARELQRRLRLDVERLSAPRRIEQLALRAHMVRADRTTTRIIVRPAAASGGEQVAAHGEPQIAAVIARRRDEAHR